MNAVNESNIGISQVSGLNFLIRLKNLFSKVFSSEKPLALPKSNALALDEKEIKLNEKFGDINIEKLQELFEHNEIKESDIPEKKLEELISLYIDQIITLDKKI